MDSRHRGELILLSREICESAADRIARYCAERYCGVDSGTAERQTEDCLFVSEETSLYLLGNALALLDGETREAEIRTFTEHLRRAVRYAQDKADGGTPR